MSAKENRTSITVQLHPWVYHTVMGYVREGRSLDRLVQEALVKQVGLEGYPLRNDQVFGTKEKK